MLIEMCLFVGVMRRALGGLLVGNWEELNCRSLGGTSASEVASRK